MQITTDAAVRTRTGLAFLAFLLLLLWSHLFGALLAALATFALYTGLLSRLQSRMTRRLAASLALALTLVVLAGLLATGVRWAESGVDGGLAGLLKLLATILDQLHARLPQWLASRLPASAAEAQHSLASWLRGHAQDLERLGHSALRTTMHMLLGVILGILSAFESAPVLAVAWARQVEVALVDLAAAFAKVVAAQVRIAAVNTAATAVFVLGVLPLSGMRIPFAGALVGLSFVAGMLPIVGNLVSNAAIVLVALTVSPLAAGLAAAFLLAIHKLEYVLNAHFVGQSTRVPASVLIAAMVVLEAVFGIAGLVAAPIYCAWIFRYFGVAPEPPRPAS